MNKMTGRPTKPAIIMGLIAALAMGAFGLFFLGLLIKEGAWPGIVFMVFWFLVLGVIFAYYLYNLKSRKGVIEIETEAATPAGAAGPDFDEKLRKLELLKKDGLVTDEEYRQKRTEIMKQNW
jgi:hypothetical protein